jgi:hypothetical protein
MDVQPALRALALHPFRELPASPGFERIERDGILLAFDPYPNAQIVEPLDLDVGAVPTAVAAARAAARQRGKQRLAWWIAPERDDLSPALEQEGLVNKDTPGYEAIENAMVLVDPPNGEANREIAVKEVESYDDFIVATSVWMDAFEIPDAVRAKAVPELPKRWNEYRQPGNPIRNYLAKIGGGAVGTATSWFSHAGINLFGGAVVAHARGLGVYRALTVARWEEAVRRATPALTVQAGRLSMPILAKLGFVPVGQVRIYVDDIEAEANSSPGKTLG